MMKIGSLKEVCVVDESKVMTKLRHSYNWVGDKAEKLGYYLGSKAGKNEVKSIPIIDRYNRGYTRGHYKAYEDDEKKVNTRWKKIGKKLGAYDDEPEDDGKDKEKS